jgi:predicted Zn-dependent peptidase
MFVPMIALAGTPELDFERRVLDNGLEVLIHTDDSLPIVAVSVWYHVGSKDEPPGRSGFAHLFEHLMFQWSEHHPGEYFEPLQSIGASINGSTNPDRTDYWEVLPSNHLERALWLESDRMGFLLGVIDQSALDEQREVVRNERRQRYENAPYGMSRIHILEAMFPEGHPYRHPTIGSHEDLEAASVEDVKAFFRVWYGPNNATIALAGDIDAERGFELVERWFGDIPRGPDVEHGVAEPVTLDETQRLQIEDDVQFERIELAWHSPAYFTPGDAELDVLATILSGSKTSRLYKRMVFEDRIASSVRVYQASGQLGSRFQISATAAPGYTAAELLVAIDEELEKLLSAGVTDHELTKARNQWKASFYGRLETVLSRASALNRYNHYTGEPDFLASDLERYQSMNAEALMGVAREVLKAPRVELTTLPKEAGK